MIFGIDAEARTMVALIDPRTDADQVSALITEMTSDQRGTALALIASLLGLYIQGDVELRPTLSMDAYMDVVLNQFRQYLLTEEREANS